MITRRLFLKESGLALLGLGVLPLAWERRLWAAMQNAPESKKVLLLIIQRGAMDGLSMVAPVGDPYYAVARPNIAIRLVEGALPLGSHFALHPSMKALLPYWQNGQLAFVHQSGSPNNSRSHFDAQDWFEAGTPGDSNTSDGFLNRALAHLSGTPSAVRGVALQPNMPRVLQGPFPAISMDSLADFQIKKQGVAGTTGGFEAMYAQAADKVFRGVGREVFDSIATVQRASQSLENTKGDGKYPKGPFAKRLREIAALIQANVGLQVAVTDMGGWDTHVNQGDGKQGQLGQRFEELAGGLAAFAADLGPKLHDVCVVTVTEFGRTFKENGNRGTDHGHGSVMSVLGGGAVGGKIHGAWKELSPANLFEGRDVPVLTDQRTVMGEILQKHLGLQDLNPIFPQFPLSAKDWLGVLRA